MVKKFKGGDYTGSNTLTPSSSLNSNVSSSSSINSNKMSTSTKYLIVFGLILLLCLIIGIAYYFYKRSYAKPTESPTSFPTTSPTFTPTTSPTPQPTGPYHPSKLLGNNQNNQVVTVIKGHLQDFGDNYTKLEKHEKKKFKRCFKNPLNNNCSF